jgi:hypothetical protein
MKKYSRGLKKEYKVMEVKLKNGISEVEEKRLMDSGIGWKMRLGV